MNIDLIRARWCWFAKAKYVWIAFFSTLIALLIGLWSPSSEQRIRLTGLILQLLGVATVVWGIAKTRADFGYPPIFTWAKGYFSCFPIVRRSATVAPKGVVAFTSTGTVTADATNGPGLNPTIESRLDTLEKNMEALHGRITTTKNEMQERFNKANEALFAETASRTAEDALTRGMLEKTATGGVHISAMGATWLFVGVFLSTAAPELAGWLK